MPIEQVADEGKSTSPAEAANTLLFVAAVDTTHCTVLTPPLIQSIYNMRLRNQTLLPYLKFIVLDFYR